MIGGKNHRLFSYHDDNKVLPLQHIRTVEELSEDFAFVNDSKLLNKIIMGNTKDFIKNIDFSTKPIADGLFAPHIENEQELMRNLIDTTFKSQYKMAVPEFVNKRIEKELEIINNKNF
jgi:DNA polymerase-3 subunit alpha (Gram-positive type)